MKTLYILTGQTATGKTENAIALAKKTNGEIINFDSRQIYKHLDIVTGKDVPGATFTKSSQIQDKTVGYYTVQGTKIWLYDIVEPQTSFSSYDFEQLAIPLITKLFEQNKTPILVGGSYLYIYYLLYGNNEENKPDYKIRETLNTLNLNDLIQLLNKERPGVINTLNESDRNNPHRIIRLLEGKKTTDTLTFDFSFFNKLEINNTKIAIQIDGWKHTTPESTRKALEKRVAKRIDQGAIEEVHHLLKMGFTELNPGLLGIGYKQIISYIKKEIEMKELIRQWVTKEYQYAKRQLTFMKKDPHIKWHIV